MSGWHLGPLQTPRDSVGLALPQLGLETLVPRLSSGRWGRWTLDPEGHYLAPPPRGS